MKVLMLDRYLGYEIVEIEEFNEEECVKTIGKRHNVDEWIDIVDKENDDDFYLGGGDENENFNEFVLANSKKIIKDEFEVLIVNYWMFCVENGWFDVDCEFVRVR